MWNRKLMFAVCLAVGVIQSCGQAEFFGFAPTAGSRQENAVDVPKYPDSPGRRSPEYKDPKQNDPADSEWFYLVLADVSNEANEPPVQRPAQDPSQEPGQNPAQDPGQASFGLVESCGVWLQLQDWMDQVGDAGLEAQLVVAPYADVVLDQRLVGPVPWEYRGEQLVSEELCRPVHVAADVDRAVQFAQGFAEQECQPVQVVWVNEEEWAEGELLDACDL